MPEYAIATRCPGGWLAHLESPRSGCTQRSGNTYCCSDAVARSLPGGRLLPASGASDTPAGGGSGSSGGNTPWQEGQFTDYGGGGQGYDMGGKTPGGGGSLPGGSMDPNMDASMNAAAQQGANDAVQGSGNGGPSASWASRNWPWLVGGGVLLAGVLVVGGVFAFGGSDEA